MTRILYGLCGSDIERHFSPHVWKSIMSLKHKGLEFELKPVPFTAVPGIEGGCSKTVPVLKDGDKIISDSFAIALYLDEAYPDRPSLFGGEGGKAMARFVEGYSQNVIHTAITKAILLDIYNMLAPKDQEHFRRTREARFGMTLEEVAAEHQAAVAAFPQTLVPIRHTLSYQPWIGGQHPLFCDYILFGALQWARICSPAKLLPEGDPATDWFERCLDLYEGTGRSVAAAA
ncbi:glutathione S-transferase family protein [Rhizobium sp. L1K21]|uniref:glutathione S-transferase family protein n=1 Tax=Rhizobium sp. L1K21 TaxID=2954933 RepID=UPI002092B56E|nr:glutathione S-transferase family protein [Rhizobium sp. L1K21]MCO6186502.1 glutathione S-transferase family protein [Rhizobium sp. L1K21]